MVGRTAMVSGGKRSKAPPAVGSKQAPPYTARVLKAASLLTETKLLLSHWDSAVPDSENLRRFRDENLFGKASRSRVEDILAAIQRRYLSEEAVTKSLLVFARTRFPATSLSRVLYFHTAKSDLLIHDAVTEILLPRLADGTTDIDARVIQVQLTKWIKEGRTAGDWSESTLTRVARGLLSALRDFGLLEGAVHKRIAPTYLPVDAFAYIAFYLRLHCRSAAKLVNSPDWRLFFLQRDGVERLLFEAHQRNLLEYHVAGSVARLTFPADTLEEYAHVLSQG